MQELLVTYGGHLLDFSRLLFWVSPDNFPRLLWNLIILLFGFDLIGQCQILKSAFTKHNIQTYMWLYNEKENFANIFVFWTNRKHFCDR